MTATEEEIPEEPKKGTETPGVEPTLVDMMKVVENAEKENTPVLPKTMFKTTSGLELLDSDIPPISYIVDILICEDSFIYLAGPPGSFKTGLMLHIALCGVTEKPVFGFYCVRYPFKTLFIDEENGKRRTKYKFDRLVRSFGMSGKEEVLKNIDFQNIQGFKINGLWIEELEKIIIANGYKLVVIDNIARCFVGSERDEKDVSKIQTLLKPVIERQHVTIVILHHCKKIDRESNKYNPPPTLNDIRGSGDFGGQCDEAFLIEPFGTGGDHTKRFTLYQLKIRDGEEIPCISIRLTGDAKKNTPLEVLYEGNVQDMQKAKRDKIVAELKTKIMEWWEQQESKSFETTYIIKQFKNKQIKDYHIRDALKCLETDGSLVNAPYKYYTNPAKKDENTKNQSKT
ncbi:MAG: AAA family ATPase [Thermoplasmata archaeon]|nr:AAA family ATPase [Thermoplasmata archaeon]MBE3142289.1 AAA family ATPase [Thermoplasmata archaeon]